MVFEGRHIFVRALQDFEKHQCTNTECKFQTHLDMGADVKISYIDVMDHTQVRRRKLQDTYFFTCQCQRCQGSQLSWRPLENTSEIPNIPNKTTIEDMMYSIRCQNCSQGFPIILGPTMENIGHCKKCYQKPSKEVLEKYQSIKIEVEEYLEKGQLPFGIPQKCVTYVLYFIVLLIQKIQKVKKLKPELLLGHPEHPLKPLVQYFPHHFPVHSRF